MLGVVAPPGDHKYVPPGTLGVAVNVALSPLQIVAVLTETVNGFTAMKTVFVAIHPNKSYVTVYVVGVLGVAITELPVDEFKLPAGLHV